MLLPAIIFFSWFLFSWLSINQAASWSSPRETTGVTVILACELTDSIVGDIAKELPFSSFLSAPFMSPEPIGKGLFTGGGDV